jgi:DNA transposition AAA+ family ATPase
MTISDQLRKAISECGLSMNQVAKRAGVPQPVLSHFLSSDRDAHRDIRLERTADKLAAFFGMKLTAPEKPTGDVEPGKPLPRRPAKKKSKPKKS